MPASLHFQLAQILDPRVEQTKQHHLLDILAIAILAQLCGADSFTETAQLGRAREPWLRSFLALLGGIPSHDTSNRVSVRLDPEAFAACLSEQAQSVASLALEANRAADTPRHPATRLRPEVGSRPGACMGLDGQRRKRDTWQWGVMALVVQAGLHGGSLRRASRKLWAACRLAPPDGHAVPAARLTG